jgi:hypothetical protein
MNCHFCLGNFSQVPEDAAMARFSWIVGKVDGSTV